MFLRAGIYISLACWAVSLQASSDPIIAKYRVAACIPFASDPAITPPTREWKATLTLRDGSQIMVGGLRLPGNGIEVSYPATGQRFVAAKGVDYVYPSDIRIGAQNDLLYIKATGLVGGIWQRTYLFEYDLRQHRLLTRRRVKDSELPEECPDPGH